MREELLRHFDGGFLYGDKQVGNAGGFDDGLVQDLNGRLGSTLGVGVGSKDHGVAASDHADGVVDHRGGRVGGRRHGGDHAPGSVFDEGQAHVAGNGHGGEAFGAGSTLANEDILGNLVAHAAHAGFVVGDFSERLGVFKAGLADGGDDLVTHGDGADLLLSGFGGLHGVFEAIEEAEVAAVAAAGGDDGRSSRSGLIGHHLFQNFNDNAFHVLLAHVHIYTPMLEAGPRGTLRTAGRGACFFCLSPSSGDEAERKTGVFRWAANRPQGLFPLILAINSCLTGVYMVDDADNDQIQRRIFVDGKTCGTAAGHDNPFALARADGIGGNLRAADGFALLIEQINEKQRVVRQTGTPDRGNDLTNDFCEFHVCLRSRKTVFREHSVRKLPTGPGREAPARPTSRA